MALGAWLVQRPRRAGLAPGIVRAAEEFGADRVGIAARPLGDARDEGVETLGRGLPAAPDVEGRAGVGRAVGQQRILVADQLIELGLRQGLRAAKIRKLGRRCPVRCAGPV
jgi:hypothetical protein